MNDRFPPGAGAVGRAALGLMLLILGTGMEPRAWGAGARVFNVRDYGATGRRDDDARPSIQRAIEACGAAGGGVVSLPPGIYTSGTLRLRSHLRFRIEAGATLLAAPDPKAYDCGPIISKAALLYGEDLEDVVLEGQGILDGQAEYEWKLDDFEENFDHKTMMQRLGKSLARSVPKGFPKRDLYPHLVWLGRCKDVKVSGLNFLRSPSWTFALYACQRVSFDGLYIYTSLKEAVWADGIDLDGCSGVSIANCAIETGDDCVALVSANTWGPALACENVCVTNCRLASASAGIKFSEGNRAGVRNIQVVDSLFNQVNRGFVFLTALGGAIRNVTLENLTINCRRGDWFWAGDGQPFRFRAARIRELDPSAPKADDVTPGVIRDITIRNVIARAQGSSLIYGHPESYLQGVHLENVKLFVSTDPAAPYDLAENALDFRRARDVTLREVEVLWDRPALPSWKSALNFEDVAGLVVERFTGSGAWPRRDAPAIAFKQVSAAVVRHCRAVDGAETFLKISGPGSRDLRVQDNDLSRARTPWELDKDLPPGALKELDAGPPSN